MLPAAAPDPVLVVTDQEIKDVVGKAGEDIKQATSTLSGSVRNIGIGLALLLYTLAIGEDKANILREYKNEVVVASLAGVCCLMADGFQYLFLWWRKKQLLDALRKARDDGTPITVPFIESSDTSSWKLLASLMFWTKCLLALFGSTVVVYMLVLKLGTPAQTAP